MKKSILKLVFFLVILTSISFSVSAQIYVQLRPVAPVIIRTTQPSHSHVWIDEEWTPNGTEYRYSGGHWVAPPETGFRWKRGHWKHNRKNGQFWVPGVWRR